MLHLLDLPSICLFILITLFFLLFGVGLTFLFKKWELIKIPASHNEFVGLVFSIIAGLYGLILAFVIFLVWQQMDDAQKTANTEGSVALGLYQEVSYYPDTVMQEKLQASILNYAKLVVEKEYPAMAKSTTDSSTVAAYQNVCDLIGGLRITNRGTQQQRIDSFSQNLYNDDLLKKLNELTIQRNLRLQSGGSDIPPAVWIPLLFGGLITLLFAVILNIENFRFHLLINSLLGCFVGMIFYLIVIIDHPFAGEIRITPDTYKELLKNVPALH